MSRFSSYIIALSLWTFTLLMMMAHTVNPEIPLAGPGVVLALSLAIASWVVDLMADADDVLVFRIAQGSLAGVPVVWALWVANNHNVFLSGVHVLALMSVSALSVGVQQIAYWERDEVAPSSGYDLLEAVRPVLTPPAALDTGSMRIPR